MKPTITAISLLALCLLAGCHRHLQKWEISSNGQVIQSGYKDMHDEDDEIPYPPDNNPDFTGTLKVWHEDDGPLKVEMIYAKGSLSAKIWDYKGQIRQEIHLKVIVPV